MNINTSYTNEITPFSLARKLTRGARTCGVLLALVATLSSQAVLAEALTLTQQLEQGLGLGSSAPAEKAKVKKAKIKAANEQNLSGEIETIKQSMVNLNRDLFVLEEDLLFPDSTQVAVYLSMDIGEYFGLDAVELRIDGEVMTHYLYTEKQVDALFRGGVQRLHVGNVNKGDHELTAYFMGIGPEEREYKRAVSVKFSKDEDAVALELSVVDSTKKQQPIFGAKVL